MIFGKGYRVRETELAQRLAAHARIYALDRSDTVTQPRPTPGDKLRLRLELARTPFRVLADEPLTRFQMPVVSGIGPWSTTVAAEWNERRLRKTLNRFDCNTVYLSTPFFFLPSVHRDYKLHFDVIDNFHDHWENTRVGRARREFHAEQIRRADTVSASSLQLCDYVQRLAGRQAVYVPNGAPLAEMRNVPRQEVAGIRQRFGIGERYVLGFIGNHTQDYYGMERIVRAFVLAHKKRPELALLIVGPGGDSALRYCDGEPDGVFVAGSVSPTSVAAYFHACDAGVHPYDLRPQTHDAMALNVIEFSAAGKPVLSNPFKEFQRLALPNVRFTESDSIVDWAAALTNHDSFREFDKSALHQGIARFDWNLSAEKLGATMGLTSAQTPEPEALSTRVLDVVQFERKPVVDYHSIEKLFQTLRRKMLPLANIRTEVCPHVSRALIPRWRNLRWAKRVASHVNHITGDVHYLALALNGKRTILTVHDCVALRNSRGLKRTVLKKLYFDWPVMRADVVTTISQATKDELIRVTGCNADKIRVIPDCVSEVFEHIAREFNSKPTVLLIGTLPHKNIERTLDALKGISCHLHIIGRLSDSQRRALSEFDYVNEYDLTSAQMARAYRDCDIVSFASLYEGFGMPILEAQATGRVVLTSNLSSMPEVAGGGACFVDPNDTGSIRAGFQRIIADAAYRAELIELGKQNVALYSAERVAKMYADIYRELA